MAKSVTNALTGVLVRKKLLYLDASAPVDAWRADDDPRGNITLRHLLHMSTGLDNSDDAGGEPGFVATMLFAPSYRTDTTNRAVDVPLVHEPGSFWAYSTGNSQILGGVIHRTLGSKRETTNAFVATQLLDPLGISTLEMEFDKAGTFLAGSHMWASARDWARLGYLYLRDGVWEEQRILPEGWVDFSRTVAPAANNGNYGAHFWVSGQPAEGQFKGIPARLRAFYMSGNDGQLVVMVPDKDLVIVRLGESHVEGWDYINALPARIADAFPMSAQGG